MKIRHRIPTTEPRSATLDPDYAAEVERHTARGEARYAAAQRRLKRAEARLLALQKQKGARSRARQIKEAAAYVELRARELESLHRLLSTSPASAEHRGVRSYRPLPPPGSLP